MHSKCYSENLKDGDHLGDIGAVRIILKWTGCEDIGWVRLGSIFELL
jgi:hypothetical protein